MAKKQKKVETKRAPTKRQLSKWQRQQRTQRIIMIIGGIFLAFIISYVGYGYYHNQVEPFQQPAVRVNDTVFDMGYYVEMLDVYTEGQELSLVPFMADMVISVIVENELIKQGTSDLGIDVNSEEISTEIDKLNLPDSEVHKRIVGARLLVDRLLSEHLDSMVPITGEQVQVEAMLLESRQMSREVVDRLGTGDSFSSLAAEFSVEMMTKEKGGNVGWLPRDLSEILFGSASIEDIAFSLDVGVLSEPTYDKSAVKEIGYWLIEVLERDDDKGTHARGILLGSLEQAEEIQAKIKNGEDFAALAERYSQYSGSDGLGGDLGWIQKGFGSEIITETAFELEPGTLSEPVRDETIQTEGGYWLVRVADRDTERELDEEARQIFRSKAFEDWVGEQRISSDVETYLTEDKKSWAIDRIINNRG